MTEDLDKPPRSFVIGEVPANAKPIDILKFMKQLVKKASTLQSEGPAGIYLSGDDKTPVLRKALEAVCTPIHFYLEILTQHVHNTQQNAGQEKTYESRNKTVFIKVSKGRSFADTVVGLRGHIDQVKSGIKMRSFNQTVDGNVAIRLSETTKGSAQALADVITRGTETLTHIQGHTHNTTVILRGIDPTLNKRQIEQDIRNLSQAHKDTTIRARDPRYGTNGVWSCLVAMPSPLAKVLIEKKRITLSYCSCRVEEWLQVPRCFNCQKTVHLAKDCQGERVLDIRCFRCGGVGHSFKDCTIEAPKCYNCGATDHLACSTSCPTYRTALRELLAKHRNTTKPDNTHEHDTTRIERDSTKADTRHTRTRKITDPLGWTTPASKHTVRQTKQPNNGH